MDPTLVRPITGVGSYRTGAVEGEISGRNREPVCRALLHTKNLHWHMKEKRLRLLFSFRQCGKA